MKQVRYYENMAFTSAFGDGLSLEQEHSVMGGSLQVRNGRLLHVETGKLSFKC
jgi:hypothetical protein